MFKSQVEDVGFVCSIDPLAFHLFRLKHFLPWLIKDCLPRGQLELAIRLALRPQHFISGKCFIGAKLMMPGQFFF